MGTLITHFGLIGFRTARDFKTGCLALSTVHILSRSEIYTTVHSFKIQITLYL